MIPLHVMRGAIVRALARLVHEPACPFGGALRSATGIECLEHGFSVCLDCDPCECFSDPEQAQAVSDSKTGGRIGTGARDILAPEA